MESFSGAAVDAVVLNRRCMYPACQNPVLDVGRAGSDVGGVPAAAAVDGLTLCPSCYMATQFSVSYSGTQRNVSTHRQYQLFRRAIIAASGPDAHSGSWPTFAQGELGAITNALEFYAAVLGSCKCAFSDILRVHSIPACVTTRSPCIPRRPISP